MVVEHHFTLYMCSQCARIHRSHLQCRTHEKKFHPELAATDSGRPAQSNPYPVLVNLEDDGETVEEIPRLTPLPTEVENDAPNNTIVEIETTGTGQELQGDVQFAQWEDEPLENVHDESQQRPISQYSPVLTLCEPDVQICESDTETSPNPNEEEEPMETTPYQYVGQTNNSVDTPEYDGESDPDFDPADESLNSEPVNATRNKSLTCKYCLRTFGSAPYRQKHERTEHESANSNNHKCVGCAVTFATLTALRKHMKEIHHSHGIVTTSRYDLRKTTETTDNTDNHMYKCNDCGLQFKEANHLERHQLVDDCDVTFECGRQRCDKRFRRLAMKQAHEGMCRKGNCDGLSAKLTIYQ